MIYTATNLRDISLEAGRAILYGDKQERRIIRKGERNGLYINWKGGRRYLSQIVDMVVTAGASK